MSTLIYTDYLTLVMQNQRINLRYGLINLRLLQCLFPGVLWTTTFPECIYAWGMAIYNFRLHVDTFVHCKLFYFLWYFFHHFSSAILVIMSVEKFIVLYFPLKSRAICTVKTAQRLSVGAAVFYLAFNSQALYFYDQVETPFGEICDYHPSKEQHLITFIQIESALYSLIPFCVLGTTNMAIIYKFIKANLNKGEGSTSSTNQALSKAGMRGTAILITVSLTFIILTGPVNFYAITVSDPRNINKALAQGLEALTGLNHAINSVLYCVVGTKFRNELKALLKCFK